MADDPLQRLETLRADAVERARRLFARALGGLEQADLSLREARTVELQQENGLSQARFGFAEADSVFMLRLAERRLCRFESARQRASERVARCLRAQQDAERERDARQRELHAAELARRVVSRGLEQRAASVSLRTERRQEDERDDQYRALEGARRQRSLVRDFPST